MADVAYIHSNKLAKWNREYIGKDGTIYVGQKDGRLKKKDLSSTALQIAEDAAAAVVNSSTPTPVSPSTPVTVTGRKGDVNVVTSGTNYEVQNAILPFLLMGS